VRAEDAVGKHARVEAGRFLQFLRHHVLGDDFGIVAIHDIADTDGLSVRQREARHIARGGGRGGEDQQLAAGEQVVTHESDSYGFHVRIALPYRTTTKVHGGAAGTDRKAAA
jgi:hypothetical protein